MNYIKEINAFYNEIEVTPLSSSAIALWYALLHMCNKSGWKTEFSVPVGTLSLKSGLSERTVSNARNELKTKGYIDFRSRGGSKAALYQMSTLSAKFADNLSDITSDNVSVGVSEYASALVKQKETKQNIPVVDQVTRDLHHAYEQLFGRPPNSVQIDDLHEYTDKGMELELVISAVRTARSNNAGIKYATRILDRQLDAGIKTIAQAEQEEAERQTAAGGVKYEFSVSSRQGQGNSGSRAGKKSITNNVIGRVPPREP